jgi:hypothetical protein
MLTIPFVAFADGQDKDKEQRRDDAKKEAEEKKDDAKKDGREEERRREGQGQGRGRQGRRCGSMRPGTENSGGPAAGPT